MYIMGMGMGMEALQLSTIEVTLMLLEISRNYWRFPAKYLILANIW